MIVVIDYGLGNLKSVSRALETIGAKVEVTNSPGKISKAKAIVLPGVGAFGRGMENLKRLGILPTISGAIEAGTPFLGICLGLQLLFTASEEHGISKGLDIVKGRVKKFTPLEKVTDRENSLTGFTQVNKIPHMGWNQVKINKPQNNHDQLDLFKNIPDHSYFYFVHSYYVQPNDHGIVVGKTEYGLEFCSAINKDNLWGVQFHPEKSASLGLKFMENFCRYVS